MNIVHIILGIFLPPVAVYLIKGAGKDLVINILLCLLAWLPGVIHALWLEMKRAESQPAATES